MNHDSKISIDQDVFNRGVAVLGLWHLGTVYSACFAKLGYRVVGIDPNRKTVDALRRGVPPVVEAGLAILIRQGMKQGNLRFASDMRELAASKFVVLALDTPLDNRDRPNLGPLLSLCRSARSFLNPAAHVVVSSQVPVGTCTTIAKQMRLAGHQTISCVPENLQLGSAIDSFFNQQVTVIGSDEQAGIDSSAELFGPLKSEKMPMSLKTAEMTKHVLNSYLALSISFGNEVGAICQSVGVDSDQVIRAVKKDRRVSPYAPMRQGPPFSGGTLARDLMTIRSVAKRNNVRSFLLDGVARANNWHKRSVVLNIVRMVGRPLTPKKIAILGLTYKTDTDTLRRSFAIETATKLRHLGATISSYDPNVKKAPAFVHLQPSVFDAVRDADAAVIFTAWPEFQSLDYKRLKAEIKRPLVMDLPNVLNKTRAKSEGIRIVRA